MTEHVVSTLLQLMILRNPGRLGIDIGVEGQDLKLKCLTLPLASAHFINIL